MDKYLAVVDLRRTRDMMKQKRRRAGFALMWVVVGTLVVVLLVAATVPTVVTMVDTNRVVQTDTLLNRLISGITGTRGFRTLAGAYPGLVHELANPVTTALPDHNRCGSVGHLYTAAQVTAWDSTGPYIPLAISTNGLQTPIGLIPRFNLRHHERLRCGRQRPEPDPTSEQCCP